MNTPITNFEQYERRIDKCMNALFTHPLIEQAYRGALMFHTFCDDNEEYPGKAALNAIWPTIEQFNSKRIQNAYNELTKLFNNYPDYFAILSETYNS
jgi:hypothetical protein